MVGFRQQSRVTLKKKIKRKSYKPEKTVNNKDKVNLSKSIKTWSCRCNVGNGRGIETDRYIGVLVENDLKEVRREYWWGLEMLLWSEDVLLLPIWTWRGAGQICEHTTETITLLRFQHILKLKWSLCYFYC